jgi:hypothetical protein
MRSVRKLAIRWAPRTWLVVAVVVLAGCGGAPDDPEQQIRDLFALLETSAEARETGPFRDALAEAYADNRHPNRAAALQSLRAYLRYYGNLHLFSVIRSIDIDAGSARAEAVVFVALTAVPVESVGQLVSVKADAFRFDVQLVGNDDQWQVAASEWRRIASDDFL